MRSVAKWSKSRFAPHPHPHQCILKFWFEWLVFMSHPCMAHTSSHRLWLQLFVSCPGPGGTNGRWDFFLSGCSPSSRSPRPRLLPRGELVYVLFSFLSFCHFEFPPLSRQLKWHNFIDLESEVLGSCLNITCLSCVALDKSFYLLELRWLDSKTSILD